MGRMINSRIQNNGNSDQQLILEQAVDTVPIILDQVVGYCSDHFGAGC
jgi:hypothetical protein